MPCTDSCNHADSTSTTAGEAKIVFHREPSTHEMVLTLVDQVTSLQNLVTAQGERLARMERALLRPESDR